MAEQPGAAELFKALSDATRRVILDELVLRDEQTLFELCTRLISIHGMSSSRQAVSQHLDVLEKAGLVWSERKGRYKFHYIDTAPLATIAERWPQSAATRRNHENLHHQPDGVRPGEGARLLHQHLGIREEARNSDG